MRITRFCNSYSKNSLSLDLGIIGDYGKISDNLFFNGTAGFTLYGNNSVIERNTFEKYGHFYRGGYTALLVGNGSNNNTIKDNIFDDIKDFHAMNLQSADDNYIVNNLFNNSGGQWHTIMDPSGYRNHYQNNHFENCNRSNNSVPWYQTCLVFWFWSFPDDYYGGEHLVEDNYFHLYKSALRFNSFQNNNTVRNNFFDDGFHGIGLWTWPQGSIGPSGNLITNNTLNDTYYPIALDYFYVGEQGVDNNLTYNTMTNTGGRAITVWSTFKNFTIHSNLIVNASIGIWVYDDAYGGVSNGMIYNNTIMDAKYTGIQVVTSWGSTFSISDIHINNNYITTEGNGIFARDVEEGYFANNTILGNLSHGSQGAGIVGYYCPELKIINNTISSAIGVEVGGISDASLITVIESNEISVSGIGVLSNRTFTKLLIIILLAAVHMINVQYCTCKMLPVQEYFLKKVT